MNIVQNHVNDIYLYINRLRCQEVFQISTSSFQHKKIKLLNFIQWYAAKKYETI